MSTRFEFDVVNLKTEHDERGRRCFKWRSARGACHDVDHSELECMLNQRGQEGWQVVAFDTDSRFGSNLILQRAVPGTIEVTVEAPSAREKPAPPTPAAVVAAPVDLSPLIAPLIAELQALREQIARAPVPQVTVQPTPVHVASPTVNYEAVRPQLEAILATLKQIEAGQPVAARVVEKLIEEALAPPPAPQVEPKFNGFRRLFHWSWATGR